MIRKEVNRISEVGKALISVEGNPGVALNHVVELLNADNAQSLSFAKAINITEDFTRFQVFNGTQGLSHENQDPDARSASHCRFLTQYAGQKL